MINYLYIVIEGRLPALGWGWGSRGTEQKPKRTHGHGWRCGDCRVEVAEGIRGINGNGKNTLKQMLVEI